MSASGFAMVVGGRGLPRAAQSSAKLLGRLEVGVSPAAVRGRGGKPPRWTGRRGRSTSSRAALATTSVSGPIAASRGAVTSRGTIGSWGTSLSSSRPL